MNRCRSNSVPFEPHIRGPNLVGGVVMWRQHKGDAFAASKMSVSVRRDEEERHTTLKMVCDLVRRIPAFFHLLVKVD
jgi:hypothetical protein